MKIDLSCPAELWRLDLPTEADRACALKMYNLSGKVINSVEVTLLLLDAKGEERARLNYRAHGLCGEPGKTFRMSVPLGREDALPDSCEVIFEKIWFDMGDIWRRDKAPMTTYVSNALLPSRELERLRHVAGDGAVGYPSAQKNVWVCVCGRANALDSDRCCRCERRRDNRADYHGNARRNAVKQRHIINHAAQRRRQNRREKHSPALF